MAQLFYRICMLNQTWAWVLWLRTTTFSGDISGQHLYWSVMVVFSIERHFSMKSYLDPCLKTWEKLLALNWGAWPNNSNPGGSWQWSTRIPNITGLPWLKQRSFNKDMEKFTRIHTRIGFSINPIYKATCNVM